MYYQNTRTIKTTLSAALILAAGSIAGVATAQVDGSIIQPQAASTSYNAATTPGQPENTIDQSGLSATYTSGTTDFDSFVPAIAHNNVSTDLLLCNSNGQNSPNGIVDLGGTITLDLGSALAVDALAMWSTIFSGEAINMFDLYADTDNDFTNGTTALLGSFSPAATDTGQSFVFPLVTTRFVHIVVTGHGGGDFLRLSEIAFRYAAELVSNTTQGTQHLTLQDALDNAASGDAITIAAGTLFEDNIIFPNGLDVTITGAGMNQTFIDGGGIGNPQNSVLAMTGSASAVSNLTVQNGYNDTINNSGAAIINGQNASFGSVAFRNHDVGLAGGVPSVFTRDPGFFEGCLFTGGEGNSGFSVLNTTGVFQNCLFYDNPLVSFALFNTSGDVSLYNCTIEQSAAGIFFTSSASATINATNSITLGSVSGPGTVNRTRCLFPGATGDNIDGTPTFVDAANGDYRLAVGSLGIDAADYDAYITAGGGAFDLNGDPRAVDGCAGDTGVGVLTYLDMGAYEVQESTPGLMQWADSVINFSSQFGDTGWSAAQALWAPNTLVYGDFPTAWAPSSQNGTVETITLGFATPMYSIGAVIRESSGSGFVTQVDVRELGGGFHTVWTGTDPSVSGSIADFEVSWPETAFLVDALRVTIDTDATSEWEEIDALQLLGNVGNDCNANGVPDGCETDTDGNGVIDDCEDICLADVNHDGAVTPADFTAWIAAFNAMAPECDQNGDGNCTPADFTAWIANFNAGCS